MKNRQIYSKGERTMSDWNSKQYMKFDVQRTQPSRDLINRIDLKSPMRILDIGCGPGNSTYALKERFPDSEIIGIDNSDDMLKRAENDYKDIDFIKCSVPDELHMLDGKFDLIFSNACIHWIPNQEKLIYEVMELLNSDGRFAVQIPLIQEAPFYKMLNKIVVLPKWKDKLGHIRKFYNLLPEEYYDLLSNISTEFEIWQTTYYHIVNSFDDILQWYKGSGLRPYLDALNDDETDKFIDELKNNLPEYYSKQANGKIILKMPRLFFKAVKK